MKTFTIILNEEQAGEVALELRKLQRGGNIDPCIGQVAIALSAAKYGKAWTTSTTTIDDSGNVTINVSEVRP